ncbi:MAG: DUF4388 domain-containing protein [Candidatus Latescibacteria bacterium]|nr:DUF4388 domain-containing protein [Candidatus Latescibacterota bacterium]NIM21623.1 DUF4388 domain-containing protein [Candidatus Latescibacterota bacterium]NIM64602.1 DUF4388 domain-containing protein [Candidatus Latescibacterota bacterium]NIO01117.1 DUF4388 domain-containing protein [Candidatus Latescibacterota bacterium]NIO27510.1 DUF4388 domain-containing protein [Candidatus Latescibacterota bacterium]
MDLEGKLNVFEPTTVFQMLNLAQITGRLTLDARFNSARIYFILGNITYAELSNRPLKLGEYLVREGLINSDQLDKALRKKAKGKKIGTILVQSGAISENELRCAIENQIKEVVYEVVRWREGWFTFEEGKKPDAQDILIDIPIDHLMLEGMKRMDELGEKS